MEFHRSTSESIGLEIEFQIVDPHTLDLTDGIVPLLDACENDRQIKAEFFQSTVEIASSVCQTIAELDGDIRRHFDYLSQRSDLLDLYLCAAGTHPFFDRLAHVTPAPRFHRMEAAAGYLAHYDVTFATHVHVGVETRRELVSLTRDFRALLPVLIALSANSPFWRGHWTGYASFRHIALAMGRTYGLPPGFDSWEGLEQFFDRARRAGVAESPRDVHWEVRPRPDLGTVEVRTMDALSTLAESVGFAALIRALADYYRQTATGERSDRLPTRLPWWVARENLFQAARAGLEANYVDDRGEARPLGELVGRTLQVARPLAEQRGEAEYLQPVERLLDYPGYRRQVDIFEETDSLRAVTEHLTQVVGH